MPMGYVVTAGPSAVSAATDLIEIVAPADAVVEILSMRVGQTSDAGDAAAEMLNIQGIKGFTASGSGGNAPTPAPLETGFAAAGSTVETMNTTQANTGTTTTLIDDSFNVQSGWQWVATPEERIILSPSQRFVLRVPAPADALTMTAQMVFQEIGG